MPIRAGRTRTAMHCDMGGGGGGGAVTYFSPWTDGGHIDLQYL